MVCCEHCGQRLLKRHGIALSPKQADLFDIIERCTDGIDTRELADLFHPGLPASEARDRIKANIYHIRQRFAGASVTIGCIGRNTYKVLK
jgi:hypothetical protein